MKFSDVPNLAKFERFAQQHQADEVVNHAYRLVEARFGSVDNENAAGMMAGYGPEQLLAMKDRCAAVEESTRIIWACAAATGNVEPNMWEDHLPEFQEALDYFWNLPYLEWMALTHSHRITWERRVGISD